MSLLNKVKLTLVGLTGRVGSVLVKKTWVHEHTYMYVSDWKHFWFGGYHWDVAQMAGDLFHLGQISNVEQARDLLKGFLRGYRNGVKDRHLDYRVAQSILKLIGAHLITHSSKEDGAELGKALLDEALRWEAEPLPMHFRLAMGNGMSLLSGLWP